MRGPDVHAVAKLYRGWEVAALGDLASAERLVRAAGVPVPNELHRSVDLPLVIYEYVEGEHRTRLSSSLITQSAAVFVRAVVALADFEPSWAPRRPSTLPRRAREAGASTVDSRLVLEIRGGWQMLHELAASAAAYACHSDWRADNLLYRGEEIVAVLDWESLVRVPVCEALGYAAAAVTHSWREELYRPVEAEPAIGFLAAAQREWAAAGGAWFERQAYTACRYAAVVRLAEDRARGCEGISLAGLCSALPA